MKYLQIKDNKNRQAFLIQEKTKKIKKYIFINLLQKIKMSKNKQTDKILFSLLKLFNKNSSISNSKTKINRRCVLTNRNRGVFRPYGISRFVFRDFIHFGLLPGYKKAIW